MGDPMPAAGISHSGWTDLANTGETFVTKAEEDPLIDKEMVDNMAAAYLGDRSRTIPLASPYYADLRGLPPLLMQVGGAEVLLDDTIRTAERAKEAGVDVTVKLWEGMPHVWQVFVNFLPEAQLSLEECGQFIRKHTAEI